ncbi:PiggyBac transposable element-derived protein 4 [Dictyocoela muelleri]|nr:PiggyBac transposable element-derived protein 4 [Dictyocoela muelleri]
MPQQTHKPGIKLYICCESSYYYVCRLSIYIGNKNKLTEIVPDLVIDFNDKNHKIYIRNFYSSMNLFNILQQKNIFCSGTMRQNRIRPDDFTKIRVRLKKRVPCPTK